MPNGKLVCVEVDADSEKTTKVKITGDFFLHPEDALEKVEQALTGVPLSIEETEVVSKVNEALGDASLIGATAEDLARIFKKAVAA